MKKKKVGLGRGYRRKWTPLEEATHLVHADGTKCKPDTATFVNSRYVVQVRSIELPDFKGGQVEGFELTVKERENYPHHDWRDLQQIKNEVLHPECFAIEVYPPESRLVDTADQWWLYCWPPTVELPFGFRDRVVTQRKNPGGSQREFAEHVKPVDLGKFDPMFDRVAEDLKARGIK